MKTADKTNVFSICNDLDEHGVKPTLARVRENLGGGSFSTIQPLLKAWKNHRNNQIDRLDVKAPEDMLELGGALVSQIWRKAEALAEKKYEQAKKSIERKISELESEQSEAISEIKNMGERSPATQQKLESEKKRADSAEEEVRKLSQELKTLQSRVGDYEKLLEKHKALQLQFGQLEGRLEKETLQLLNDLK